MIRLWLALFTAVALAAAPPAVVRRPQIRIAVWCDHPDHGAKAFSARLDGKPARILDVKRPGDDLLLLVVLDMTGDMALVQTAKDALAAEIGSLGNRTRVALMRAQDGLSVVADPTTDHEALANALREIAPSGKAGLLDTVETAEAVADSILAKTAVRVAVLYVSDSDIQNYREDYTNPVINSSDSHDLSRRFPEALVHEKITRLKAKLSAAQAPLFVVHLNYRSDKLNEAYQNGLKELAETTAGTSAFCRSSAEIGAVMKSIFGSVVSHYSVSMELPAKARRAVNVHLSLDGSDGPERGLNYRTRIALKGE